jgi:hypothetical protein
MLAFSATVFSCSVALGSEDPTAANYRLAFQYFLVTAVAIGTQVFVYRYSKRSAKLIFWPSLVLGLTLFPLAMMFGLVMGGTNCGVVTVSVGYYLMLLFIVALLAQSVFWLFGDERSEESTISELSILTDRVRPLPRQTSQPPDPDQPVNGPRTPGS